MVGGERLELYGGGETGVKKTLLFLSPTGFATTGDQAVSDAMMPLFLECLQPD